LEAGNVTSKWIITELSAIEFADPLSTEHYKFNMYQETPKMWPVM
jgi:hypothetical protein